jgi:hypothetical protein
MPARSPRFAREPQGRRRRDFVGDGSVAPRHTQVQTVVIVLVTPQQTPNLSLSSEVELSNRGKGGLGGHPRANLSAAAGVITVSKALGSHSAGRRDKGVKSHDCR